MRFAILGSCLTLATYLAVSSIAAMAVALGWRRAADQFSARTLFWLRVLPVLAGAGVALGLLLPSYLVFEPRAADEHVGATLGLLASIALATLVTGPLRGIRDLLATNRAVRGWLANARRLGGAPIPAYVISHPFPIVAIAGILRPKLLVAAQVEAALEPSEIEAVVAHELAHVSSRDNAKALILRSCPDLLSWLPAGRRIASRMSEATEIAADARAAASGHALPLAGALLKVARLAPAERLRIPLTALHEGGSVARRVDLLLAEGDCSGVRPRPRLAFPLLALAAAAVGALASTPILLSVHQVAERALLLLR